MSVLYFIGNGFDLYNGLKTRYADFHQYIIEHFSDLENKMEEYFSFETDEDYLWKNFEHDLGTFDYKPFFDTYNHIDILSESFKPSESFGLEDEIKEEVDNLIQNIKEAFTDWVEEIDYPKQMSTTFQFSPNAKFINFNYTDTLELLYNVPKESILYIHNNANDRQGELIFGHGLWDKPEPEAMDELGNSNKTIFSDAQAAARYPFYALVKNTDEILSEHSEFFKDLNGFREVIVLGHSLGEVDWPYFKRVCQVLPNADWKFSYYSQSEMESVRLSALKMLKIGPERIKLIKIDEH